MRAIVRVGPLDLDHSVGAVAGDDLDFGEVRLDGDRDGCGGGEDAHGVPLVHFAQPVTRLEPRREAAGGLGALGARVGADVSRAAADARTSQALTERPSRSAAASTRAFSESGIRRLIRLAPSSGSAVGVWAGAGGRCRVRLGGRWRRGHAVDDEAGLAPAQPYLHRPGGQLECQLVRRSRQGLEQRQTDGRPQRKDEALGERLGLGTTRRGGHGHLTGDVVDIAIQVHGTSMAPLWHRYNQSGARLV